MSVLTEPRADIGPLGVFRQVHDLDEYRDLALGAESETVQLGPGHLEASLFRMGLGDMILNGAGGNTLPLSTTAAGPKDGIAFVVLLRAPAWGDFNGQPHSIGGCQVLGPSGPILTHNAPGAEVAIFQAPPEAIRERAYLLGRDPHVPERFESIGIPGTAPAARSLKEHLSAALDVAADPGLRPESFDAEAFRSLVKDDITTLAALALDQQSRIDIPTFQRRRAIVQGARAYIEANAGRMVSLTELCSVTMSSERTLQYAFREVTGLSPTAYLRLRALHWVHAELRDASPAETTVTDVAMRWGFWHLGRFAASYRATFGTSPSQELRGISPEIA